VLRVAEDQERAGISTYLDIKHPGTKDTDYKKEQLSAIDTHDFTLVLGSPSYALRALDNHTLAYDEVQKLKAKADGGSVIASWLLGDFNSALPEGFGKYICANLCSKDYYKELPSIVAKIYGCDPTYLREQKKYKSHNQLSIYN
jgi:hypothetical protein